MRVGSACLAVVACGLGMTACGGEDGDSGEATTKSKTSAARAAAPVRCTPADDSRETITISPRYRARDRRELVITKTRQEGGAAKGGATTTGSLTVLSGGPRRARLRLQTAGTDFGESVNDLPKATRDSLEQLGGFSVEFRTDADGAYASIADMAAARAQMRRAADALAKIVESDPNGREAMKRTRSLMNSDAFIEQSVSEIAGLLLYAYGFELTDERRTFKTELPNRFGGDPFPARAALKLVDRRDNAGCVVMEVVTTPDPERFQKILVAGLERLAGKPIPADEAPEVRLRNTVRYRWDPGSGWIVGVRSVSDVTTDGSRRVDTTVIDVR